MNVFEAARQVDCISAAERLEIPVKQSGSKAYARCLFHADKTPSMCLYPGDGGFYCFGCHEHGDAIRLYAQALNLAPLEAAKRICADFGLSYVESGRRSLKRPTPPRATPRMDVRTLADKLVTWREQRVDELLARLRTAEAKMLRIEDKLRAERWERFMDEIMTGPDAGAAASKVGYFQKAFGYALTGNTRHECLFILYGATTRNGKGTAMETFLRLMGDYGKTARPETIGTKFQQNSNGPSEDIARLNGARFVNISEPDKKLTLSAALVKTLTGNDTITARFLHENSFEFRPQFKMFINTNYLPQITDLTLFSSGRIKTIPFERHFDEHEQDKSLKELFGRPENLSGILNWCMDGLHMLEAEGFAEPQAVRTATEEYEHNSDKLALFMEECLRPESKAMERTSAVYAAYQSWCEENGFRSENIRNFKALLSSRAQIERRSPYLRAEKTTVLVGYRIRDETTATA